MGERRNCRRFVPRHTAARLVPYHGADAMRLSVIQMEPGHDKAQNIAQADSVLTTAVEADQPHLVALPETWACLGGGRETKLAAAEELPAPGQNAAGGPAYEFLRGFARKHRI